MEIDRFRREVEKDLREQKRLGVPVSDAAIVIALTANDMVKYAENMSVEECADLLRSLYP